MLLLFDIDGTLLLGAAREHAIALRESVAEVLQLPPLTGHVETAGRTDVAIARSLAMAAGAGLDAFERADAAIRSRAVARYAELVPEDLSDHQAPAAAQTLAALATDHTLALLTGNLEPIAHLKLRAAGLDGFFARGDGAFGSDSEDRSDLPDIARARAGDVATDATVVVGDTPLDIACARAGDVRCVAVTTGQYDAGQLAEADAVIASLAQLPEALGQLADQ